jgi:outer membrane PBP1 activator LpoA protein
MLTERPARMTRLFSRTAPVILAAAITGCAGGLGSRDAELSRALTGGYQGGETVAVLLPQSGRFAGAADALKQGIVAAQAADGQGKRPQLRFYDTSGAQSATAMVSQAAADGASYVIGPLQKQAVDELAGAAALPIPVLALNRVSTAARPPANLYQFSLSPEDEAAEAARRAWEAGHRSALVLYPDGPWGDRMSRGFSQQWAVLGGRIAATEVYSPGGYDFDRPVGNVSAQSANADFLFLIATSQSARALAPRIRASAGGNLPVYSTSHIYGGGFDPQTDQALSGLYFVDIPWLVAPNPADSLSRDRLRQSIPGMQDSYTRLYAMGIDAYRLVPRLSWMSSRRGAVVEGKTGLLKLDSQGKIVRGLTLARMGPSGPTLAAGDMRRPRGSGDRIDPVPLLASRDTAGLDAARR